MSKIQLNLDCEGPITINDNAFELCAEFLPNGSKFFYYISRYDDYLYYIEKKDNYKAGDTLKLILPFLIAFDVSLSKMTEFSQKKLNMLEKTRELLPNLFKKIPTFIISTSYCPYITALCHELGLDPKNNFCTQLSEDLFSISEDEKKKIKEIYFEILKLPELKLENVNSPSDLTIENEYAVKRLNFFFWHELEYAKIGKEVYKKVNPIGGKEKANAILEATTRTKIPLQNCIYIGDSITDMEAFELVKSNGGLAIAFNGNDYALKSAEFAIAGKNFLPIYHLVEIILSTGIHSTKTNLNYVREILKNQIKEDFLNITPITTENYSEILHKSKYYRNLVRGKIISDLG